MNYIGCADLHIAFKRPQFRCDDYFKTVCRKFRQIVYLCNKYKCDLIVAGDFFDSVKVGYNVLNSIIKILKTLKGKCFVVAGQHDMTFHSHSLVSTPLQTLIHMKKVILLKRDKPYKNGDDYLYGCSFGEEPIEHPELNSILVIHKSITPSDPPFFLTEAVSATTAINLWSEYKLIIAGDFHEPFFKTGPTSLINCGPMLRQKVDQMDIKPLIWLIKGLIIKPIQLKIEPSETVFNTEIIKRVEESLFSKSITELVKSLKVSSNKPDPVGTVNLLMKEGEVSEATKNRVNSIMGSVLDG